MFSHKVLMQHLSDNITFLDQGDELGRYWEEGCCRFWEQHI